MDEAEKVFFQKKYEQLSDKELKRLLKMAEDDPLIFKEGVHKIILAEAKKRNLEKALSEDNINKTVNQKTKYGTKITGTCHYYQHNNDPDESHKAKRGDSLSKIFTDLFSFLSFCKNAARHKRLLAIMLFIFVIHTWWLISMEKSFFSAFSLSCLLLFLVTGISYISFKASKTLKYLHRFGKLGLFGMIAIPVFLAIVLFGSPIIAGLRGVHAVRLMEVIETSAVGFCVVGSIARMIVKKHQKEVEKSQAMGEEVDKKDKKFTL